MRHAVGSKLLPLLLLLPAGCAAGPMTTSIDHLVGTWRLANVDVPAGARIPTVSFGQDGSLAGNAGVNRYRSAADVEALAQGRWRIQAIGATRMAGPAEAMVLEQQFLTALEVSETIAFGDGLLLLKKNDQVVISLEPLRVR